MHPYIIEIICGIPANKNTTNYCHASVCALATNEEDAVIMAKDLILSHGYIAQNVEAVALKNSIPLDENSELDELLYQKALQRQPPCALQFYTSNPDVNGYQINSLKIPRNGVLN